MDYFVWCEGGCDGVVLVGMDWMIVCDEYWYLCVDVFVEVGECDFVGF